MAVNSTTWKSLPVAARELEFNADQAITNIFNWGGGDTKKIASAFFWRNPNGAPNIKDSYRLPMGDIINGRLTMVPRAIFSAAQILSGAHGGLKDVIGDVDRNQLKAVLTQIYDVFQKAYGDQRVEAPWLKGRTQPEQAEVRREMGLTAAIEEENVSDADEKTCNCQGWEPALTSALDMPVDLVRPPREWFEDPNLQAPTPLTITADGRVVGMLAAFGVCHMGIGNQCVMAPRSNTNYQYFNNGSVLTADGTQVRVGKITLGTGHADTRLGWIPATEHYDHTGTVVAVVATGEGAHGIWMAGAVVPGTSEAKIAELRRSPLSGDWRRVNGNLELVAALAVNTPGFPIVSMTASGEIESICAAGVVLDDGTVFASQDITPDLTASFQRLEKLSKFVERVHVRTRQERLCKLLNSGGNNGVR